MLGPPKLRLDAKLRIIDKPAVADRCCPNALGLGILRDAAVGAFARVEANERGALGAADNAGTALGTELTATAAGATGAGAAGIDGAVIWKPGAAAVYAAGAGAAEAVPVRRDLVSADTTCTSPEVTSTTPSSELLLVT